MCAAGLKDGDARVRGQAAFAIGQLADNCAPEIAQHARQILPALFPVIGDADATTQDKACYALEALCEQLGAPPSFTFSSSQCSALVSTTFL